jgi:hypothetical protein
MVAAVVVTSRLVNERPDDGSYVQCVCSNYLLHVLSRYMCSLSVGCKLWAAGRCVLVRCCRLWVVLMNIRRQSNKMVVMEAGLPSADVRVTALADHVIDCLTKW